MRQINRLLVIAVLTSWVGTLHAQWTQTNGPRMNREVGLLVPQDTFLVAANPCGMEFMSASLMEFVLGPSSRYAPEALASLNGDQYVLISGRLHHCGAAGNAPWWGQTTNEQYAVSDVTADGQFLYGASYTHGIGVGPSPGTLSFGVLGLPADTTVVQWDTTVKWQVWKVAVNDTAIFAGTSRGIYRASKANRYFFERNTGLPAQRVRAIYVRDSLCLVNVAGAIYRSVDAGASWLATAVPLTGDCARFRAIGDTLYACYEAGGLLRSTDGGQNWALMNQGLAHDVAQDICTWHGDLWLSSWDGVYRWLGNAWTKQIFPINCYETVSLLAQPDGIVAAGTMDAYKSIDGGASWAQAPINPRAKRNSYPKVVAIDGMLLLGQTPPRQDGPMTVSCSDDGGWSWDSCMTLVGGGSGNALSSNGHEVVVSLEFANYYISDSGRTVQSVPFPPSNICGQRSVMFLLDSAIYATSCWNSTLSRSYDRGLTWNLCETGLPNKVVCYAERVGDLMFATMIDDIYKSADGGATWHQALDGIDPSSGPFFDLEWDGVRYYVSNGYQVWASYDGAHWTENSLGLPAPIPTERLNVAILAHQDTLYFASANWGVWKMPISQVVVASEAPLPGQRLILFPNPATDRLFISNAAEVKSLELWSAGGVRLSPTWQSGYVDVASLPAGVYFLRAVTRSGAVLPGRFVKQ